jgi:hypothetical protein
VTDDLRQRRHLLFTMLTACAWRDAPAGPAPVVAGLRAFLGGWPGIGRIVVGMARQGYDLQLTRYGDEGWRATFYPAGDCLLHAPGSSGVRRPDHPGGEESARVQDRGRVSDAALPAPPLDWDLPDSLAAIWRATSIPDDFCARVAHVAHLEIMKQLDGAATDNDDAPLGISHMLPSAADRVPEGERRENPCCHSLCRGFGRHGSRGLLAALVFCPG